MTLEEEYIPRKERLTKIYEAMRHRRTIKTALPDITSVLHCGPSDYRKFTHSFDGHKWSGVIYHSRNSCMGSIFSYWDSKAMVIPGYPKIKYADDSKCKDNECYVEEKIDGTNLGFWMFPNGELMGKTRMVERYDLQGFRGRNWKLLTQKCLSLGQMPVMESLKRICKDDYSPFGELYGTENPGEFIRYTNKIDIKFFEICDLRTFEWVSYDRKIELLNQYGLDPVGLNWHGVLNSKEVQRLEYEAKALVKEDGMEGFVAKFYDPILKDTQMCKLKCEEIKEIAWSLSPRMGIPKAIISKAVKKAWDNQGILMTMDDIVQFVKDELREEVEEPLIAHSEYKIKEIIYAVFNPVEGQEDLWTYFKELEDQGISMDNKSKILSMSASKFRAIKPKDLYTAYCAYIISKNKEAR